MFACLSRKNIIKTAQKRKPTIDTVGAIAITSDSAPIILDDITVKNTSGGLSRDEKGIKKENLNVKNKEKGKLQFQSQNQIHEISEQSSIETMNMKGCVTKQTLKSITDKVDIETIEKEVKEQKIKQGDIQPYFTDIIRIITNATENSILHSDDKHLFSAPVCQEQSTQQQIKVYMNEITNYLTPEIHPKTYQSTISTMMHKPDQFGVDSQQVQILQVQIKTGGLLQAFFWAAISLNHPMAIKIFDKMNKNEKNCYDQKGMSIIKLLTLLVIKNNNCKESVDLLKTILKNKEIIPCQSTEIGYKPIQQAILYKNIPTLTHLFKASYQFKSQLIRQNLRSFLNFLNQIQDFQMQLNAKVGSFLPLIEKIAPDDRIRIIKRGSFLRIDYSLVGYQALKCKRRKMSCIIGQFIIGQNPQQPYILAVNHDHKVYTNLLEEFSKDELALIIEDLLCTQYKRGNPSIKKVKIKNSLDLFGNPVQEKINQFISSKHWLKIKYDSHTQKLIPGSNSGNKLKHLDSYEDYEAWQLQNTLKMPKMKDISLGVWIPKTFPIPYHHFIKIMEFFSLSNETGKLISDFLKIQGIGDSIKMLPTKIQIPINFTLYIELEVCHVGLESNEQVTFDYTECFKQMSRPQYQKTHERMQKRLFQAKLYL